MKDEFYCIYDEVEVIKTGNRSHIVGIVKTEIRELDKDGLYSEHTEVRYRLHGFGMHYTCENLTYIGSKAIKEDIINSIIYDVNLKTKNFEFIKNMLDSQISHDGLCECGGGLHTVFYGKVEALRCVDCNLIKYDK